MSERSTYLFARPSFFEGIARLVDFGGSLNQYNTCETGPEADQMAMNQDFAAVGDELRLAVSTLMAAG